MSGDPLGPVVIGAREVYDAVVKLTGTVERLVDGHADADRRLVDHEARLRALERSRWPLPSVAALVAVASLLVATYSLTQGGT